MKTTSLELSKRLKVLGVPQVSDFYWSENEHGIAGWNVFYVNESLGQEEWFTKDDECISSYSSDELGEWLSTNTSLTRGHKNWSCRWWTNNPLRKERATEGFVKEADTLAEAMGLMMEFLIINGYIKVEDLK